MKSTHRNSLRLLAGLSLVLSLPATAETLNEIRFYDNAGGGASGLVPNNTTSAGSLPTGIPGAGQSGFVTGATGLPASPGANVPAGLTRLPNGGAGGTDQYTMTAQGSDYWGQVDRGAFAFDNTAAGQSGNFSAIVRSVALAVPGEAIANNWGRSGIGVRVETGAGVDPNPLDDAMKSLRVETIREHNGVGTGNANGLLGIAQNARPYNNSFNPFGVNLADDGTGGGDNYRQYPGDQTQNSLDNVGGAANSSRNTAIWLNISRYNGVYYSSYAVDTTGGASVPADAVWSPTVQRAIDPGSPLLGTVQVGLIHQAHTDNLGGSPNSPNTGVFDNFRVDNAGNNASFVQTMLSRGQYPQVPTGSAAVLATNKLGGQAFSSELGLGIAPQAVSWKAEVLGAPTPGLHMDIYTGVNNASSGAWSAFLAGNPAAYYSGKVTRNGLASTGVYWSTGNYDPAWQAGGQFPAGGDGQENYSARMTGQIYIPAAGSYKFKDGSDDYSFLRIGNQTLIDDNNWTSVDGSANGGSPIVSASFAAAGWYDIDFRMAEGGGGDNQALYWDFQPDDVNDPTAGGTLGGNSQFPTGIAVAAGQGALVPDSFLRSFETVLGSIDHTSLIDGGLFIDENGNMLTLPNGDSYVRLTINGQTGIFLVNVPEPSTGLLALAGAGLLLRRRRK